MIFRKYGTASVDLKNPRTILVDCESGVLFIMLEAEIIFNKSGIAREYSRFRTPCIALLLSSGNSFVFIIIGFKYLS